MGCRAQQRRPTVVDPAGIRTNESADRVEERRLAGAVRSDDGDDLARLDTKGNLIQRQDPPEADGEVDNLEGRPRKLSHLSSLPSPRFFTPERGPYSLTNVRSDNMRRRWGKS